MPTTRAYIRRPARATMTATQEMELWLGVCHYGTTFASDAHRRATWFRYRDRLMQRFAKNGKRPQGWWWYEAPEMGLRGYAGYRHQQSILWETPGVLSEDERAQLEQWWREQFDRSWDEHFFFCAGPDKIFSGDDARWQHFLWADIPPELVDKWMAERQRRGRTVRKLQEEGRRGDSVAETGTPPEAA